MASRRLLDAAKCLWGNKNSDASTAFPRMKSSTVLNTIAIGLAIALCFGGACFIYFETTFDVEYSAKGIYRLSFGRAAKPDSPVARTAVLSGAIVDVLSSQLSDSIADVAMVQARRTSISLKSQGRTLSGIYPQAATPNIEKFFNIRTIEGSVSLLKNPDTAVLAESISQRLFGEKGAIGQHLTINFSGTDQTVTVVAVVEDVPENTHLDFNLLYSVENLRRAWPNAFVDKYQTNNFAIYVKLHSDQYVNHVEEILKRLFDSTSPDSSISNIVYELQPVREIHLNSKKYGEFRQGGDQTLVLLCLVLVSVIFFSALGNQVSRVTADSSRLSRELAVRTVIGADSRALYGFAGSLALRPTLRGLALFILFILILRTAQPDWLPSYVADFPVLLSTFLILTAFICVFLSGILYPVVLVRTLNVWRAICGSGAIGPKPMLVRQAMLAAQTAISIAMIGLVLLVGKQILEISGRDPGLDLDGVLVSQRVGNSLVGGRVSTLEASLREFHTAVVVSAAEIIPTMPPNMLAEQISYGGKRVFSGKSIPVVGVEYKFAESIGARLVAGRDFSSIYPSDRWRWTSSDGDGAAVGLIVTRSFVANLGDAKEADVVGSYINFGWFNTRVVGQIVGVVEDILFFPAASTSEPVIFALGFFFQGDQRIIARFSQRNDESISWANDALEKVILLDQPGIRFLRSLFEDARATQRAALVLISVFCALSLFLAIVSSFGIALTVVDQHKKDIAIRRIIGAKKWDIINLIFFEYFPLLGAGTLIAFPCVYYGAITWFTDVQLTWSAASQSTLIGFVSVSMLYWVTVWMAARSVNNKTISSDLAAA